MCVPLVSIVISDRLLPYFPLGSTTSHLCSQSPKSSDLTVSAPSPVITPDSSDYRSFSLVTSLWTALNNKTVTKWLYVLAKQIDFKVEPRHC